VTAGTGIQTVAVRGAEQGATSKVVSISQVMDHLRHLVISWLSEGREVEVGPTGAAANKITEVVTSRALQQHRFPILKRHTMKEPSDKMIDCINNSGERKLINRKKFIFPQRINQCWQEDIDSLFIFNSDLFKAGKLYVHTDNWRMLDEATNYDHTELIKIITEKLNIENTMKYMIKTPEAMINAKSCTGQEPFIRKQINEWSLSEAIEEIEFYEGLVINGLTVAGIFAEKLRLCLHSLHVNEATMEKLPLKLPVVAQLGAKMHANTYFSKIDCKSGFLQFALKKEHRRLFGFKFEGKYFQFKVMPWGLTSATYYFQMVQQVIVRYLRENKIYAINYIDDLAITGSSKKDCLNKLDFVLRLFTSLGYYLSRDKIQWEPTQMMEFLGIGLDAKNMKYYCSDKKLNKLKRVTEMCMQSNWVKVEVIQKLLGYLAHLKQVMNMHGAVAHALVASTIEIKDGKGENFKKIEDHVVVEIKKTAIREIQFWHDIKLESRFMNQSLCARDFCEIGRAHV
jgi:hypothetical protein